MVFSFSFWAKLLNPEIARRPKNTEMCLTVLRMFKSQVSKGRSVRCSDPPLTPVKVPRLDPGDG